MKFSIKRNNDGTHTVTIRKGLFSRETILFTGYTVSEILEEVAHHE